jgi:hypothetical protein
MRHYRDAMTKAELAALLAECVALERCYEEAGDQSLDKDDALWLLHKAALDHKGRP